MTQGGIQIHCNVFWAAFTPLLFSSAHVILVSPSKTANPACRSVTCTKAHETKQENKFIRVKKQLRYNLKALIKELNLNNGLVIIRQFFYLVECYHFF